MLGLIFALPFILVLIVFALSNATSVALGFWPTDLSVVVPLSLAVLGSGALFFVLGALVVGITSLGQRRRARRAEGRVKALERELEAMRPRPMLMPGTAVRTIDG
ncbi:lipopolysaccharide assembly protein LapA domain-containing protein [Acidisphaera sp. L21]|uniref:lipopolysaccharide assembly protein LapA domain-containing protein n=1 Tax=Acidisphaera sp. L21 TaxID=1641851 RepID=UPI00131D0E3C|nr:LapA family protein [Acidisphaera sp. L21]